MNTQSTSANSRKGQISVQTTDIFPIIKKWLYSEHDIFLRELVANATDAITKRAALARTQNVELPEGKIHFSIDKDRKCISIEDNGLGMTEEEVEKYIAQLAFSGAEEFVEQIKSENQKGEDIIGKFGLGFYSCFMVAGRVEVESLSWEEGARPTKWVCEGDTEYTFSESQRTEIGTSITLFINSENEEFLNDWKVLETLRKFCNFMPYPIEVKKSEPPKNKEGEEPLPDHWVVNEVEPLWKKDPKDITDEQYKEFYRTLFPMEAEPLFWLHLRIDHPFTLEGILYFPKINPKMAVQDKNIKLYNKQVFVSSDTKSIVPDFLSLLKGVIDSTDIPLNVSRSSLQGDPTVKKISNYVVKKVAEALKKLFNSDRQRFENIWEDIGILVKYGCVSDDKFDQSMRPLVIFKTSDQKWQTIEEYRENIPKEPAHLKEKMGDKILYFEKDKGDPSLLGQLKAMNLSAFEVDDHIDPHFIQHCEGRASEGQKIQFSSVSTEIDQLAETDNTNAEDIKVKELFQKILVKENSSSEKSADAEPDKMEIEIQKFKQATTPAFFKVDEQMKRFARMSESMGQGQTFPLKKTLVLNPNSPLIQHTLQLHEKGGSEALVEKLCRHISDLASISGQGLSNEERDGFIRRSQDLIQEFTQGLTG